MLLPPMLEVPNVIASVQMSRVKWRSSERENEGSLVGVTEWNDGLLNLSIGYRISVNTNYKMLNNKTVQ